jgi:tetratricopeptide (TPR) repeat protein
MDLCSCPCGILTLEWARVGHSQRRERGLLAVRSDRKCCGRYAAARCTLSVRYRWGVRHFAYFKALANETSEHTTTWRSTLAGLVAMRLLDAWVDGGALPIAGMQALECAINMMDVDAAERVPLTNVESALRAEIGGRNGDDDSKVLVRIRAYAEVLWQAAAWELATDCCRTIIRYADTPSEHALIPLTYDRLGYCLRAQGLLEAAGAAFQTGRGLAIARGDRAADLQLRISEANLEMYHGRLPAADCLLDEIAAEATFAALPQLVAKATHNRGVIAYERHEMSRALEFYLCAFDAYGTDSGAERVLADMALVAQELGGRAIARYIFESLVTHSTEQSQRSAARINLLQIAAEERDESLFDAHRHALARATLSVRHEAHYHLFSAEGWLAFDRPTLARQAFERAIDAVRRGGVAELEAKLTACKERLEAASRKRTADHRADELRRSHERIARPPVDLHPLMVRTAAAAHAWRGGRESISAGAR